ncbi:hypothetical protein ACFL6S_13840 [Candidatus Poribacteria bacterium]
MKKERVLVNPFVFELNKFNTQNAEQLNAYDELNSLDLNIPTKLDHLIDELGKEPFRVVILTGDAGDGKTRFCRKLIEGYRGVADYPELRWKETIEQPYIIVYKDASAVPPRDMQKELAEIQDELSSEDGLSHHSVIAVNEGKLRDLCGNGLEIIWDKIQERIDTPSDLHTSNLVVVNLNHRNIAAGDSVDESIVGKAILVVTDPSYWEERESENERCLNCSKHTYCSIWGNVQELRKNVVRERLWQLFVIHSYLDPGTESSHITMRGLLAGLSHIITGNLDCGNVSQESGRRYFNNIFSNDGNTVIRQLCRIDVSKTSSLEIDRQIYSELSKEDVDNEIDRMKLYDERKREFYLTEDSMQKAISMLPFKYFHDFGKIVSGRADDDELSLATKRILRALNRLESPHSRNDFFEQWVIGKTNNSRKHSIIQGRDIANSHFALKINDQLFPYIETQPTRLRLCLEGNPLVEPLDIDLLLYELLMHTADGFVSRQPYELLFSDIDRFRQCVMGTFGGESFYVSDPTSGERKQIDVSDNKLIYRR